MLNLDLVEGVLAGHPRAVGRAVTLVEEGGRDAKELLKRLRNQAGRAHVVGITGAPGAGKSTLINQLAKEFRIRGRSVGIIAIDPTSSFTRGAILGDRVRMQGVAADPSVFVRSMATRGRLGGLGRATEDVVIVLDAAGMDVVVIETVGVGQDEVDVAAAAQTTVVVMVPSMGDEIQTLKAGILEVADVFTVNKADLDGADRMALQLSAISSFSDQRWVPPVIKTVALSGSGVHELVDAIESHRAHLSSIKLAAGAKRELIRKRIFALAGWELLERLEIEVGPNQIERLIEMVASGESDPYTAADVLVRSFLVGKLPALDEQPEPGILKA